MILKSHLQELSAKYHFTLELEKDPSGFYLLSIDPKTELLLKENALGFTCKSEIGVAPKEDLEDFLTLLMRANYLGQGTGGAILCLNPRAEMILLQLHGFGDFNFVEFKDKIEEFVNYLNYWKTRISDFTKK